MAWLRLLLLVYETNHFVPVSLRVFEADHTTFVLFFEFRELFVLLRILALLLVLEDSSRVDESGALFGTGGVTREPVVGRDLVDQTSALTRHVVWELNHPVHVFDLFQKLHDHIVGDVLEVLLVFNRHLRKISENSVRDVDRPRLLLLSFCNILVSLNLCRSNAACHVLSLIHLLDFLEVRGDHSLARQLFSSTALCSSLGFPIRLRCHLDVVCGSS